MVNPNHSDITETGWTTSRRRIKPDEIIANQNEPVYFFSWFYPCHSESYIFPGALEASPCCGFFFLDSYEVPLYTFCPKKQIDIKLFLFRRESKALFRRDSAGAFIIGKNY